MNGGGSKSNAVLDYDGSGAAKDPLPRPRKPPLGAPRPRSLFGMNPPPPRPRWNPGMKPPLPLGWYPLELLTGAPLACDDAAGAPAPAADEGSAALAAFCAACGPPRPLAWPPRPRLGFAIIWIGPAPPCWLVKRNVSFHFHFLSIFLFLVRNNKQVTTYCCVAGAGRKPAAAACPGDGLIAGWGPKRGLKGTWFLTGGGALGLVEVTNWGLVKLRHVLNSTVEPRYCEQLIDRGNDNQ